MTDMQTHSGYANAAKTTVPAVGGVAITPSDTVDFTIPTRSIYVGGSGVIACIFADGSAVVNMTVFAGAILPLQLKRINSTNTTATLLVGLY